jgi:glycosyltransferase involved in cell wall biosynthesis
MFTLINILLVPINDLASHPTETRFISIAKKLVKNFDVNIFALRYKNIPTASKARRKLNFELLDFNDIKSQNIGLYYLVNVIPIFSALRRQLKKEKIDIIIHANILPSSVAVGLGRIFHVPVIFDYQDHFPESAAVYFKGSTLRSLAYTVTNGINNFNIKHSDAVVTVTDAHKDMIKRYDPLKPVKVIPNGVDTDLFKPIPRSVALEQLGLEHLNEKKVLLYFGSIDSWLNFSSIFNVVKRFAEKGIDVVFLIVGYSHSKYFLEELKKTAQHMGIGDRVLFLDPVPQSRLVYYINASDMTLAPFRPMVMNQAVPLKILESLACGRPVCATNLAEIAARFKDVVRMYSSEEELEKTLLMHFSGKAGVSFDSMMELVKEYSWDNFATSYYDLIMQMINQ